MFYRKKKKVNLAATYRITANNHRIRQILSTEIQRLFWSQVAINLTWESLSFYPQHVIIKISNAIRQNSKKPRLTVEPRIFCRWRVELYSTPQHHRSINKIFFQQVIRHVRMRIGNRSLIPLSSLPLSALYSPLDINLHPCTETWGPLKGQWAGYHTAIRQCALADRYLNWPPVTADALSLGQLGRGRQEAGETAASGRPAKQSLEAQSSGLRGSLKDRR